MTSNDLTRTTTAETDPSDRIGAATTTTRIEDPAVLVVRAAASRVDIREAEEGMDLRETAIAAEDVVAVEAAAAAAAAAAIGEEMRGGEEEGATDPLMTWGPAMTVMWVKAGISTRIIMMRLDMEMATSLLSLCWVAEMVLATVGFHTKAIYVLQRPAQALFTAK